MRQLTAREAKWLVILLVLTFWVCIFKHCL